VGPAGGLGSVDPRVAPPVATAAAAPTTTGAAPLLRSTSQGAGDLDYREGNSTALARGSTEAEMQGGSVLPWSWIVLFLCLVCCILPIAVYLLGMPGASKTGGLKKKRTVRKIGPPERTSSSSSASLDSGANREVEIPLVQAGATSLFDILDSNHDGVITAAEFNQAFGVPPPRQSSASARTQASPAPAQRRASATPILMTSARTTFVAQPELDLYTVTPWGTNIHHLHGAPPPPGVPVVAQAAIPANLPVVEDNA